MKQQTAILPDIVKDNLDKLYSLCKEHKILHLWLFGSVIRDDFRKDSDVDVLYEFDDDQIPETEYLKHFWGMWDGLEALWDRKVDFVHYPDLRNPYFKASVDASKVLIYDAEREKISI
ncbi:MAG: nucleotidyltransferase domain-containing protein [Bacteroidia bacterium]